MFSFLAEIFAYPFMQRAVIVGILVSLCCSLLGVSLVLKRYSMIGDGLSHVAFGALSIALALGVTPLKFSIPIVIAAAFMLLQLNKNSKLKGDAAIALISSSALAIGVVVTARSSGLNTDICNYMFGSILAMSKDDVVLSIVLSVIVILMFIFLYNRIFAITFDENFAAATGIHVNVYNLLLAFLTAVTIVIGMRLMGALLISSLIIFPPIASMRVCKSFRSVIVSSAVISIVAFTAGMIFAYLYETPTGASIVIVNLVILLLLAVTGKITKRSD